MTLPENFADFPKSLAEVRSERTRDCSEWTPRDALIDALRRIDAGEIAPTDLVLIYRDTDEDGDQCTRFSLATDNAVTALGLISRAAYLMQL